MTIKRGTPLYFALIQSGALLHSCLVQQCYASSRFVEEESHRHDAKKQGSFSFQSPASSSSPFHEKDKRELNKDSCQEVGSKDCQGFVFSSLFNQPKPNLPLMIKEQDDSFEDNEELDVINLAESGVSSQEEDAAGIERTQSSNLFHHQSIDDINMQKDEDDVYDVVIVGAGWSGITAARQLQTRGIANIKVLEARDYIGGRTHTLRNAYNGTDSEWGTNWLMFGNTNPLFELALKSSLNYMALDDMRYHLYMPWGPIKDWKMGYYFSIMYDAWWYYMVSKSYIIDQDESIQDSIDEVAILLEKYSDSFVKKKVLRAMIQMYYGYQSNLDQQSLYYGVGTERSYLGGYYNYDGQRLISGWSSMIDLHAEPIKDKIQMQAVVSMIKYKNDIVKVFYEDRSDPDLSVQNMIKAKKVIVTLPLGVLKERVVKFQPALPVSIRSIIDTIGFSKYIKMNMFWNLDDIFWDGISGTFGESETIDGTDLRLTWFDPCYMSGVRDGHLMVEIAGSIPLSLEESYSQHKNDTKYEEEMSDLVMESLRRMFGDNISNPAKVVVSKWNIDPFAYGAYSVNYIGFQPNMRQKLRKPIADKVFLSGEATSTYHYATAHGAMYTGIMAATKVCKSLFQNSTELCGH